MQHTGLCIDGPLDGQRLVAATPTYQVEVRKPTSLAAPNSGDNAMAFPSHTVVYRLHEIMGVGLWLLKYETPQDAVTHMVETIGMSALADRYQQIIARRKDDTRHGR